MKKKLKSVATHLLDLGKRNRLLNYRSTGLRSLSILNKDISNIFEGIKDSKSFSIFSLDSVLKKYHDDLIINPEDDDVLEYSDSKVFNIASKLLGKNQLLCYKRGYTLNKVLKSLIKEYKFSITEKGINSLYLSFGFVEYVENKESFIAPLLLIPIEIVCEKNIFKIKEYEDEVLLNPTLKHYYKSMKNIDLIDYNDEKLSSYFKKIKELLHKKDSLIEECAIGLYSFLKMNMYNDLITNVDLVIQNRNIKALLGDTTGLVVETIERPVHPVVNCDSSQLEAIGFAANGYSFVLQGPPGSGKSQTITNIISTLISNGKHVLFVSEKLAALNVVYDNLKKAGLSEFAIELHSNKANKKEFIDSLYKTAMLPKYDISTNADITRSKHEIVKESIKDYYKEIHKKITGLDYSIYELISLYLEIDVDDMNYRITDIDSYSLKDLDKICGFLDEYINYSGILGYSYRELPFYGLRDITNDYVRYEIEDDLRISISYLKRVLELKNALNKHLKVNANNLTDVYNSLDLMDAIVNLKTFDSNYFNKEIREELVLNLESYLKERPYLKSSLLKVYDESILKLSLEKLYLEYKESKDKDIEKKILSYRNDKAKYKVLIAELEELVELKKHLLSARNCLSFIKSNLNDFDLSNAKAILADLKSLSNYKTIKMSYDQYVKIKPYFTDILISFKSMFKDNETLMKLSTKFDNNAFNIFDNSIQNVLAKLEGIYFMKDKLQQYSLLNKTLSNINKYGFSDFIDEYLSNSLEISDLSKQFKKAFYRCKIYNELNKSAVLSGFASYNYDKLVDDFRHLDEMILNINRDEIISKISKKRPDDVLIEGSKFKILASEASKLKRQKPIRILLDEIFELALDIKPVFLMSPLSVSTYLANKLDMFDCVIFDEASQIFAWDALGAIYRAKQCIIIGDNKQMPPSNFFGVSQDDEDNVLELDSILDVASLTFLTSRLKWHYRSRSEELIAFSNKGFYDNGLITIPQASKHRKGFGIDFYYLPDGRYDADTRTNMVEATKICDMVFEHFDTSKESLGVVAFSDVQARLIEDLIEKKLLDNPKYNQYFDESLEEPFFVKNLESVQGDERDRIIFSICYGYNEKNKFYQRFGPLNNLGGERRLNVAITRAKYNVSVVSSIRHVDIKLDNTKSIGVEMLKDYLEFIENIEQENNYNTEADGVIASIKKYLEDLGYSCYTNYGRSSFKIDIAVKKDDEFILAIMLDSKEGFKVNTTDRQRLEKLLLERLGWKYYRIYSAAWFTHRDLEKEKLLKALNNEVFVTPMTEEISIKLDDVIEESDDSFLEIDDSNSNLASSFREYESLDIDVAKKMLEDYGLEYTLKELIRVEQPIHIDYLYKKASSILGIRISNVLKKMVQAGLSSDIINNGGFLYLDSFYDSKLRINSDRLIEHISHDELKDGIYTIIKQNNGITIDGCYKTLISVLGYNRVNDNTKRLLDDIIVFLKLDGSITQRGECLFV